MTTQERHILEEVLDELGKDRHNVKYQTLAKLEALVDGNAQHTQDDLNEVGDSESIGYCVFEIPLQELPVMS